MAEKPTYEGLEQRIIDLEKKSIEHELIEEELRSERDKLNSLLGGLAITNIGVDIVSVDYEVLEQNQTLIDRFGNIVGKKCYKEYMGLEEPCDFCPLAKALENNKLERIELRGKDGKDYEILSSPMTNADGKIDRVIEVIIDITERKQAEAALRESEERFRQMLEDLLIGILIIQDGQIAYKNPEYERLFGTDATSIADSFFKNMHSEDAEKMKRLCEELASGKIETVSTDFRYKPGEKEPADSSIKWIQCRASAIQYKGEKAVLFNLMDVTKVKELEQALRIEDKMSSLGRVAAGIAHEIRNPLTGINSYLYNLHELFSSEILEGENQQMVSRIIKQLKVASQRIESVIKRVMDFSKPATPKMILTDINQPIQEASELSSVFLRKAGIELEKHLTQNLPQCYMDPQLINQVVLNLINNAASAMKNIQGTKKIRLTTSVSGNDVFVSVSDSGPGVSTEIQQRIFDPFFTTRSDGSGIGLSIVQRIAADHGGTIEVTTGEYGGAEFVFRLPVEKRILGSRDSA